MLFTDLRVVNLHITEDYYDYRGQFRLQGETKSMDLDLMDLEREDIIIDICTVFELEEDASIVRKLLMEKIMEASQVESRIVEGKQYNESTKDKKKEKEIGALDLS